MNPVLRVTRVALSLLAYVHLAIASSWADESPPPAPRVAYSEGAIPLSPTGAAHAQFVGSAGCSAVSCHGGRSLPGAEFTHWAKFDHAHRRAYEVLHSELSQSMARKLGIEAAHQADRCLKCHVAPESHLAENRGERFAFEHGVGCESCHGPAGEWVTNHTQTPWKSWSREQKATTGFRDLKSLVTRTETCVVCHVGSAEATIDHDLIAAGHPRLLFDMAAFHDQLPKHWDERSAAKREPDQELRLWFIGQAASARALSEVVATRAEAARQAGAERLVPDLAEWDCHACHHDLADETWRGGLTSKPLGAAQWGSWIIPSARVAAHESQQLFARDGSTSETSMKSLADLFQTSRFRPVDTNEVFKLSRQASLDAAHWLRSLEVSRCEAGECAAFGRRLVAPSSDRDWPESWDGQTQRWLALLATRQTLQDLSGNAGSTNWAPAVQDFQNKLRYPAGYSTPQGFRPDVIQQLIRRSQQN